MAKWVDNIYIGGEDEESFLENVKEVCQCMKKCDLRAAPKKTIIAIKETTIMGWHWREGSQSPIVHKINPLAVCEKPKTVKGLRSFLGGMHFYKRCICRPDNISQPLDEACPNTKSGRD